MNIIECDGYNIVNDNNDGAWTDAWKFKLTHPDGVWSGQTWDTQAEAEEAAQAAIVDEHAEGFHAERTGSRTIRGCRACRMGRTGASDGS